MDDLDTRLTALLAMPDRAPDVAFANEIEMRLAVERRFAARLAAERASTATLLLATVALAIGLWLFAQGSAFAAASDAAGGGFVGLAAVAGVMLLWLATGGAGSLASD